MRSTTYSSRSSARPRRRTGRPRTTNCALAWHYPYGDHRRIFGQGTPKEVWHLMEQTWTVVGVPTNARITEDISGWERVCDKIIETKG